MSSKTILLALSMLFIGGVSTPVQSRFDGIWQSRVQSGGSSQLWSMELSQNGSIVTGTIWQDLYRTPILEGQIQGDRIAFRVDIPGQRTIAFSGEIGGDEIEFTRTVEVTPGGSRGGSGIYGAGGMQRFVATRVPAGSVPAEPRGLVWPRRLILLDRDGEVVRALGEPDDYIWPVLSPDAQRLAVITPDRKQPRITSDADPGKPSEFRNIWVIDLATGERALVASGPDLQTPVWSPDGSQIAYSSYREGHGGLYRTASDGTGTEERLYQFALGILPVLLHDWSADGRFLTFGGGLMSVLPLDRDLMPVEILREEYSVFGGHLSWDSRFVAYLSNESGALAAYVQGFDPVSVSLSADAKWEVGDVSSRRESPNRSDWGVYWREDTGELYYQKDDRSLMAVEVSGAQEFQVGPPHLVFKAPGTGQHAWGQSFLDVSSGGERFVLAVPERPDVAPDPGILARYTGTYELEPDSTELIVTLEGNQLWSQVAGEPEKVGPMVARSGASFYSNRFTNLYDLPMAEEIDFVTDDSGSVTHLITYNQGVGWTAVRR